MTDTEKEAIAFLPLRIAETVRQTVRKTGRPIDEIRLRADREVKLTSQNESIPCGIVSSDEDVGETVKRLTGGSLYSSAEEIKTGVITTPSGIRAGVCGQATVTDGRITAVRAITSVNIRIPHRVPHAADGLYEAVKKYGNVLVFSPPGKGKTTALGELLPLLSGGNEQKNVAVIDTRRELSAFSEGADCADFFVGYTRTDGIRAAVTSMAPEYLICDEISSESDADAILYAVSCGVKVVCSVHSDSAEKIKNHPSIGRLIKRKVFGALYRTDLSGGECYPSDGS